MLEKNQRKAFSHCLAPPPATRTMPRAPCWQHWHLFLHQTAGSCSIPPLPPTPQRWMQEELNAQITQCTTLLQSWEELLTRAPFMGVWWRGLAFWDKDLQLTNQIYWPRSRADEGHASWHPKICEEDECHGGDIWQGLLQGAAEQVLLQPGPSPAAHTCFFPVLLACRVCCAPWFALRSR